MYQSRDIEWQGWSRNEGSAPTLSLRTGGVMDSRKHCAYNQTQECFLGLEVTIADLSYAGLEDLMARLALKPGEGLWLPPFRGIRAIGMLVPLDLIYLDEDCRVLEIVECLPTFRMSPSSERVVSILALPARSISSSQTQTGDQLVLCVAEEMEQCLERLNRPREGEVSIQSVAMLRDQPLWSEGSGILEIDHPYGMERRTSQTIYEMSLTEPGANAARPPKHWMHRWWTHDPLSAPPSLLPGAVAYYWNGSAYHDSGRRNAGSWGLYAVTESQWHPATLLVLTLKSMAGAQEAAEHSLTVLSRGVRHGEQSVGLQFVLSEVSLFHGKHSAFSDESIRKEFELFLLRIRQSD